MHTVSSRVVPRGVGRGVPIKSKISSSNWLSSRSEPSYSLKSWIVAKRALQAAVDNPQASDDTRIVQINKSKQQYSDPSENDSPTKQQQQEDSTSKVVAARKAWRCASINGRLFEKFSVYTVNNVTKRRCTLRSIGTPHREIVVDSSFTKFNGLELRTVRLTDVFVDGDQVFVEDWKPCYSDRGTIENRAYAIGFPRWSARPLTTGDRWLTDGRLTRWTTEGKCLIAASKAWRHRSDVSVAAVDLTFVDYLPSSPPIPLDSVVLVRAVLKGPGDLAWSSAASGDGTPWTAELVTLLQQASSAYGVFVRAQYWRYGAIMAVGFGYIYVPPSVERGRFIRNGAEVKFTASLIQQGEHIEFSKHHKWVALHVEEIKSESQDPPKIVNGQAKSNSIVHQDVSLLADSKWKNSLQQTPGQRRGPAFCVNPKHVLACLCRET